MGEYFWEDVDEVLDFMLKPGGLTFEQFKKVRIIYPEKYYLAGNEDHFFGTPSGEMEIYSRQMKQLGISPLPYLKEVLKAGTVSAESRECPLILTNRKETGFMLSGYRADLKMRKPYPEAIVEIHPETATTAGVAEGDMIYLETRKAGITQKVKLNSELDPRWLCQSLPGGIPKISLRNITGENQI